MSFPTFFSAIPVPETQVGLAIETTRGEAKAPEYWLPIMGPKYEPVLQLLPDKTLRGSMVDIYDEIPGLRHDTHAWDSYPYLDSFPVLVRALLGSKDTKTVKSEPEELEAEAKAGATEVEFKKEVAAGSYVVIGTGVGTQETVLVTNKAKKATIAYPLSYTHPAKALCTGLTKHEFSLLNDSVSEGNQPPSCTLTDFAGEEDWRQLAAAQLSTLTISGASDALVKVAVDWFSYAAVTPSTPSPSYTTAEAPVGWSVKAAIGGTQVASIQSWDFDLKRNVKPIPALTGTQNYYQLFAGALDATAKLTVIEDPKAVWLDAYEAGAEESIDLTLYDVYSGDALNVHSSFARFTKGSLDRSKEWVEVPLELQLLPNSTDATAGGVSPVAITVANAHTTEY